jgi:hemoglobin-like flavoprotein
VPLDPDHVALVKRTFVRVAPDAEAFARTFYARLFELDAALRPLFTTDLDEQGRKLMAMLATAVNGVDEMDTISPMLEALGARHAAYGVRSHDYPTLGAALVWTLGEYLGSDFTDEARDAWLEAYDLLARTMQAGAGGRA